MKPHLHRPPQREGHGPTRHIIESAYADCAVMPIDGGIHRDATDGLAIGKAEDVAAGAQGERGSGLVGVRGHGK